VDTNVEGICRQFISKIMMLDGQIEARGGVEVHYFDRANHTEVHTNKPVTNQDTSYRRQPTTMHEMNKLLMVGTKIGS
jgi:hypothetical protein